MSEKGETDALKMKSILKNEKIDIFISSPYKRAIQTIKKAADEYRKDIVIFEDLREREVGQIANMNFKEAKRKLYEDRNFSFTDGESSKEGQERASKALRYILKEYRGMSIVIGTHGDIMTLMMSDFKENYGYEFWESTSIPDIYKLEFDEQELKEATRYWTLAKGRYCA